MWSPTYCPACYFWLQGMCMHGDFETGARCYNHAMCGDKMCYGTGTCAQAYVVYLNNVTDPMEAKVSAPRCDEGCSDTYYTDGASLWEYVPFWLTGHGMCSN